MTNPTEFDKFAASYDAQINRGKWLTGERKEYFARARIEWLGRCLKKRGISPPRRIIDFGCGTGTSTPMLHHAFDGARVTGVDVSAASVEVARQAWSGPGIEFLLPDACPAEGQFDLAFCNGVVHHIRPAARMAAFTYVFSALRPGGVFACWENNCLNPLMWYAMQRAEIDRDAVPIRAVELQRGLHHAGFELQSTHYLFVFPPVLRVLKGLEKLLCHMPVGSQYQVLCRKPGA